MASGALAAMAAAASSTAVSRSAAGTARLIRPMATASAAEAKRPVSSRSKASLRPTARATATPGVEQNSPRLIPETAKRAVSTAKARSQLATSWQPAATAAPCTRAMTGFGELTMACIRALHWANRASCSAASSVERNSLRSWPAQKIFPAASSTMTRTAGSATACVTAASSAVIIEDERALAWEGSLRVMRAIAPSTRRGASGSVMAIVLPVFHRRWPETARGQAASARSYWTAGVSPVRRLRNKSRRDAGGPGGLKTPRSGICAAMGCLDRAFGRPLRRALLAVRGDAFTRFFAGEAEELEREGGVEGGAHLAQPVVEGVLGPADRALGAGCQASRHLHGLGVEVGVVDRQADQPDSGRLLAQQLVAKQQVILGPRHADQQGPDDRRVVAGGDAEPCMAIDDPVVPGGDGDVGEDAHHQAGPDGDAAHGADHRLVAVDQVVDDGPRLLPAAGAGDRVIHQVIDHGEVAAGREHPIVAGDDDGVDVRVGVDVVPDPGQLGVHGVVGGVHAAVVETDSQHLGVGPVEPQPGVGRVGIRVAHGGSFSSDAGLALP